MNNSHSVGVPWRKQKSKSKFYCEGISGNIVELWTFFTHNIDIIFFLFLLSSTHIHTHPAYSYTVTLLQPSTSVKPAISVSSYLLYQTHSGG